ncbi:DUF3800 domain-containing protein [Paraburkholderia dinghuensis]|nr:DUF3800 domain-containing protein [Paraburkholderia dinghuensis]
MHVFCDESGNTGVDLLNAIQPVFALASTAMDADDALALVTPLLRQGQVEAKYSKLKSSQRGQESLLHFFNAPAFAADNTKVLVADKRFYLISHLVDKVMEPLAHEFGVDLYAGDAHVGLTNLWFYTGANIFPFGYWDRILAAFLKVIQLRGPVSYAHFDDVVAAGANFTPPSMRDIAAPLLAARGRLQEFIGVFRDLVVFDPAVDLFTALMQLWMSETDTAFELTHDRSKPLKRCEPFLRALMTKDAQRRMIGYGARQAELPLRISQLSFGDSKLAPQLQVADLFAGAAIDWVLAASGRRPRTPFHDQLKDSRFMVALQGGMWPTMEMNRENDPLPGQRSLPDGTADFFQDIGYRP